MRKRKSHKKRLTPKTPRVKKPRRVPLRRAANGRVTHAGKHDQEAVFCEGQEALSLLDISTLDVEVADALSRAVQHARSHSWGSVGVAAFRGGLADLIDTVERSVPPASQPEFMKECRALQIDRSAVVSPLVIALSYLSDILRAVSEPWDHEIVREFGIVAGADGFPLFQPSPRADELVGRLLDELQYLAFRKQAYTIRDAGGDPHRVIGPVSEADGTVDARIFRAFKGFGIAKLAKMRETLPEPSDRDVNVKYGPDWPWETKLSGLRGGNLYIAAHLEAERFGVTRDKEDDLTLPPATPSANYPPLPTSLRRRLK